MPNKKSNQKNIRRKLSPKVIAKRTVKGKRPLHKRFLLHPITVFGLLCCGVFLVSMTLRSIAESYTVTATVPAPALTEPAIITSPVGNTTITATPVTVTGTCPDSSYVALNINGIFSGENICTTNTFSIETDLYPGLNQLVAQDYNLTDQIGPTSPVVDVTYSPPAQSQTTPTKTGSTTTTSASTSSTSATPSLPIMSASFKYRVFQVGQAFQWTINVSGGQPPYTAYVSWGDGNSTTIQVGDAQSFTISHVYFLVNDPTIKITLTDAHGASTLLQLTAVIKAMSLPGGVISGGTSSPSGPLSSLTGLQKWLWLVWPVYGTVVLMVVSFWLGEYQEYFKLKRKIASSRT